MENTAPDNGPLRMPSTTMVHSPSGESYVQTEAEFQRRLAENKAKGQALIHEVDSYWQWLVETEPNKLTNELATEDFLSIIINHLIEDKKVAGADIISIVNRCVEEHRK